ncbi:transcriptional regulator [Aliivibrio fischeri]|uniref:helix-turn-helix domain-containing protein n=1 Tax=Aliivibrio fischeri TaxID=668 RepID=UPI00080D9DC3|nr:helix-turn-helix transcriptional regulator [Aliivibrio fischeri]OCH31983.1 transcriptional regulator [Aliivibrio fischeri]
MSSNKIDPIVYVLRRYREVKGFSQEQVALKTGISPRTIQRIESGDSDMKMGQYRRYLEALGLSDMDISMSLFSHEFVTEKEVAAISRRLPYRFRKIVIVFLNELAEALKN